MSEDPVLPQGPVPLTRAHERRRFSACEGLGDFFRVGAYTEPQELLLESKEPKAVRSAVQPNG